MDIQPLDLQTFFIGALAIAKEQGMVWSDVTDPNDDYVYRLYKRWGGEKELKQHKSVDMALMDFRAKLIAGRNKLEERFVDVRQISIGVLSVTLHVPIGKDRTVDFGAQGTVPTDATNAEKQYYYGALWRSVYQGWQEFKQNPPQEMTPQKPQYQTEIDPALSIFEMTSIVVETKGGERQYKVKGEGFPLHGIRVFPEVLSRAGIRADKIDGEAFFHGTAGYIKNAKGEPSKVTYLQVMPSEE